MVDLFIQFLKLLLVLRKMFAHELYQASQVALNSVDSQLLLHLCQIPLHHVSPCGNQLVTCQLYYFLSMFSHDWLWSKFEHTYPVVHWTLFKWEPLYASYLHHQCGPDSVHWLRPPEMCIVADSGVVSELYFAGQSLKVAYRAALSSHAHLHPSSLSACLLFPSIATIAPGNLPGIVDMGWMPADGSECNAYVAGIWNWVVLTYCNLGCILVQW